MKMTMCKPYSILAMLCAAPFLLMAQGKDNPEEVKALKASKELTWKATRQLEENDFVSAEADFRRAISKSPENTTAPYNLGNAYYRKESFGEAFGSYKQAGEKAEAKPEKHKAFHNMGNVFMNYKDYENAVEAYKEALRNDPTDEETRYNLALAKEMLKKQQQEQQNDQGDEKKEEQDQKDKNQDKQEQGNQEDNNKDKEESEEPRQGEDGDQGENQKEENKKGDGDEKEEQERSGQEEQSEQPQPRLNQLSPQQIENLLEAMQNEEKKVQEKMDARKVKGSPIKNKKDW